MQPARICMIYILTEAKFRVFQWNVHNDIDDRHDRELTVCVALKIIHYVQYII